MAQIKTNLQYGVTGSLQTANVANDAIGLAQMASGTDGNVITYDASGNPAVVATGTSGHFLKSQGAGSVPVFAADNKGKINQITRTFTAASSSEVSTTSDTLVDSGITVSITPSATDSVIIVDFAHAMSQYYETVVGITSLYRAIGAGADTELTTATYKWSYVNYGGGDAYSVIAAPIFLRFIDTTHNTTSACAYKIYFKTGNVSYDYVLAHQNSTYSMIATEVLA